MQGEKLTAQHLVKGTIRFRDGAEVPFATVRFSRDSAGITEKFSLADKQGEYSIQIGAYREGWLLVSAVGVFDRWKFISVPGDSLIEDIIVTPRNVTLPSVIVVNKPSIEISGDTTFFRADRFKKGNETTVGDLLKKIPGFTIGPSNRVIYNGKLIDRILINGEDLTGTDYSKIVETLDLAGIEQLQVIQNYADNENMLSKISGGSEQVLNLSYKKGFLQKLFGTADASIGPEGRHNIALQATGLRTNQKIIAFFRHNNIGKLGTPFSQLNRSNLPPEGSDNELKAAGTVPLSASTSIQTGIDEIEPVYQNKSSSATLLFSLRPSGKITLKGRSNFAYDKVRQELDNTTTYFQPFYFKLATKEEMLRKLHLFDSYLSANFTGWKNQQLLLSWQSVTDNNKFDALTAFNGQQVSEDQDLSGRQAGFGLLYNRILPRKLVLSLKAKYSYGRMPAQYTIAPAAFSDFFSRAGGGKLMEQTEQQTRNSYSLALEAVKKGGKHLVFASAYYKHNLETASNSIHFYYNNSVSSIGYDSLLNNRFIYYLGGVQLRDKWILNPAVTATISFEAGYGFAHLINKNTYRTTAITNRRYYLPGMSLSFKMSAYSRFNVSFTSNNRFSESGTTGQQYVIRNITTISRGVDYAAIRQSSSLDFFYSYTNLLQRKLIVFIDVAALRVPQFLVNAFTPIQAYAYQQAVIAGKNTSALNVIAGASKFSADFRTRFSSSVNFATGNSYRLSGGMLLAKVPFTQLESSCAFTRDSKKIDFKAELQFRVKWQQATDIVTSKHFRSLLAVSLRPLQYLFVDAQFRYSRIKPPFMLPAHYTEGIFRLYYKAAKNKWEYGLSGTHLFTRSSFAIGEVVDNSVSVSSYRLFPPVVQAYIRYRF